MCAVLLAVITSAHASCVAVQTVQCDPASEKVRDATLLFESAVMDCFFDSGAVVTSAPVVTVQEWSAEPEPETLKKTLELGSGGDVQFVILISIKYDTAASSTARSPEQTRLSSIKAVTWKAYVMPSGGCTASGIMEPSSADLTRNDASGIKGFAAKVAKTIEVEMWKR
jgi:hypothetical protein